jgi:hypothetical protein
LLCAVAPNLLRGGVVFDVHGAIEAELRPQLAQEFVG